MYVFRVLRVVENTHSVQENYQVDFSRTAVVAVKMASRHRKRWIISECEGAVSIRGCEQKGNEAVHQHGCTIRFDELGSQKNNNNKNYSRKMKHSVVPGSGCSRIKPAATRNTGKTRRGNAVGYHDIMSCFREKNAKQKVINARALSQSRGQQNKMGHQLSALHKNRIAASSPRAVCPLVQGTLYHIEAREQAPVPRTYLDYARVAEMQWRFVDTTALGAYDLHTT